MSISSEFIQDGQAYSFEGYSLDIKDTKGTLLYEKQFATEDACAKAFNDLKVSAEPYSYQARTYYPVELTARAIFLPNAIAMVSDMDDRIAKVVLGALFAVIDIITVPIRLITLIPYTFCWKEQTEHKILALIQTAPEDNKVIVSIRAEVFSQIIPGTIDGKRHYNVTGGKVSGEWKEVFLAPSLATDHLCRSGSGSSTMDGLRNEEVKKLFRAFTY